jgi:hypothetical protein
MAMTVPSAAVRGLIGIRQQAMFIEEPGRAIPSGSSETTSSR